MQLYLGIGTNLGNKEENLKKAVNLIGKRIGKVIALSSFYATEPWGFESDNMFMNAAVEVRTRLLPMEALYLTRSIEYWMGRKDHSPNGAYRDRIIDIDLLLYGHWVVDLPQLKLPHPLMHERLFVLQPMAEIAPDLEHPILKKTMRELMQGLLNKENPQPVVSTGGGNAIGG
ncbi:MAG: 2-amino-4-hydroxy-6-hydroxymethyldihydropteridine diphosphokinase [Prevotellaceae bacterium]|jgi:2-amino-4-hydroxy-6-hydroxymethyldihydropteridine diphosphokinase|nr:2-amino-4-hydroxy-6-hydroxymethyldihydropteridine diphosphokinase [Prevotellaceae bacterium]